MSEKGLQILLVEDDPGDVRLTLHALKRMNLANEVQVARDGAEALEVIFGSTAEGEQPGTLWPKLILLDLKLPKVDGLEVLRRIKGNPRTRLLPVVVLTSSREERDVMQSYESGVNSYIVKPVDFSQFMDAVCQLGLYWLLLNQPLPD